MTGQDMDSRGGSSLRFSDGVQEKRRRQLLALLLVWLNGVMGYDRRAVVLFRGG